VDGLTQRAQVVLVAGAIVALALVVPLSMMVELRAVQTQPGVEPMDVGVLDRQLHAIVRAAATETDRSPSAMHEQIHADVGVVESHQRAHGRVVQVALADAAASERARESCPVGECRGEQGLIISTDARGDRVVGVVFTTVVLGPDERGSLTTTVWVDTAARG